jgi:hypothetical protein
LTKIGNHRLIGKWRITDMELWDAEFIDMLEPAYVQFDADGGGQFVFGAVQGQLDCRDNGASLRFTWVGNDEGDQASGDGEAELQADGALKGAIRFHLGDESSFSARRW